jgi:hypothetical protein
LQHFLQKLALGLQESVLRALEEMVQQELKYWLQPLLLWLLFFDALLILVPHLEQM